MIVFNALILFSDIFCKKKKTTKIQKKILIYFFLFLHLLKSLFKKKNNHQKNISVLSLARCINIGVLYPGKVAGNFFFFFCMFFDVFFLFKLQIFDFQKTQKNQ